VYTPHPGWQWVATVDVAIRIHLLHPLYDGCNSFSGHSSMDIVTVDVC
jgi:hypothetical protein